MKIHLLFLLLLILNSTSTILQGIPNLYLDHITMGDIISGQYDELPGGYNQSMNWRQTMPGIETAAMAMTQFKLGIPNMKMSFIAQFVELNNTGCTINLETTVSDSRIKYITFTIVVINSGSSQLELVSVQVTTTNLALPQQFLTGSSALFHLQNENPFTCIFVQWVTGDGTIVGDNYRLRIFSFTPSGNNFTIQLNTDSTFFIKNIKINLLFVGQRTAGENVASYSNHAQFGAAFTDDYTYNFGVNTSMFGGPIDGKRCIIGYHIINVFFDSSTVEVLMNMNGTDIMGITQTNNRKCQIVTYCLGVCPNDYFFNTTICEQCSVYMERCVICLSSTVCSQCRFDSTLVGLNFCPLCSSTMKNCVTCDNLASCTRCLQISLLSTDQFSCILCSTLMADCQQCSSSSNCTICYQGQPVTAGCSSKAGCIQVKQTHFSADNIQSNCILCNGQYFKEQPEDGICVCITGNKAGQFCTDVAGCVSSKLEAMVVKCLACNTSAHFYFSPLYYTCLCQNGYQLQSNICVSICGDGQLNGAECDDGNVRDGDGCSSACSIQKYYKCGYNVSKRVSFCQYVGKNVQVSLIQTQKISYLYQGKFVFQLQPSLSILTNYDYATYFDFQCDTSNHSVVSWSYQSGKITLLVDYKTDLQNQPAVVNFSFNQIFIRHPPISVSFTIQSDGKALIYLQQTPNVKTAKYLYLSISIISLVVLVLSCPVNFMIGIELVNTLQIIFYLQFVAERYNNGFRSLQELSIVGLSGLFVGKQSTNVKMWREYQKLPFQLWQAELELVISSGTLLVVVLGVVLLKLVSIGSSHYQTSEKIEKIYTFGWERVMFSLTMFFFLPFVLLINTETFITSSNSAFLQIQFRAFLILIGLYLISIVMFKGFSFGFFDKLCFKNSWTIKEKYSPNYIPSYLLNLVIQSILLILLLRTGSQIYICLLISLSVISFVWTFVFSPYYNVFSNLNIYLNLSVIICFEMYLILRNSQIVVLSDLEDIFVGLVFAGCVAVISVIALIRTIKAIITKEQSNMATISLEEDQMLQISKQKSNQQSNHFPLNPHQIISKQQPRKALLDDCHQLNKEQQQLLKRLRQQLRKNFHKKKAINRQVREQGQ